MLTFWLVYRDVTNQSSIYSMVTQGLERVIAGTSMHGMLKVFDMRLAGSHEYNIINITQGASSSRGTIIAGGGWNLYLNDRSETRNEPRHRGHRRNDNSPVYSLS